MEILHTTAKKRSIARVDAEIKRTKKKGTNKFFNAYQCG